MPQSKCIMCKRVEPKRRLAKCAVCTLAVHIGCYGIVTEDASIPADWACDTCHNAKDPFALLVSRTDGGLSLFVVPVCSVSMLCLPPPRPLCLGLLLLTQTPQCVLCPSALKTGAEVHTMRGSAKLRPPGSLPAESPYQPFTALDALKATEGNQWAHVICSVWTSELVFTHTNTLQRVEGVAGLAASRWSQVGLSPHPQCSMSFPRHPL